MREIFERTGGIRNGPGRLRAVIVRESEEPGRGEEKAVFICTACGEPVFRGASCLAVRVPSGEVLRFCGECAGEALSMDGHLDRLGMRYFSGPAEDAEGWASLGR